MASALPFAQRPRSADRFGLALPVTMEGEEGAMHDLSATGVLLEVATAPVLGALVALTLHYQARHQDHQVHCNGRVVRVDQHGDRFNVAVQLSEPLFEESE